MKFIGFVAGALAAAMSIVLVVAQEPGGESPSSSASKSEADAASSPSETPPEATPGKPIKAAPSKGPVPLDPAGTVLLDAKRKMIIVNSEVVLREGMLEMLLCKKHTKEHESILAFDGKAYIVHAGLVALGIDPGGPVNFRPEYQPPTGPKLKMELVWKDKSGKEQRSDARQWIRYAIHRYFGEPMDALPAGVTLPEGDPLLFDATNKELAWYGPMTEQDRDKYVAMTKDKAFQQAIRSIFKKTRERAMDADWVFAGSQFAVNENDGHRVYLAESGDVVCVANFPSAMIDVDARSSAEGQANLLFEAWTERIPPVGTPVRIEISEVREKADGKAASTRKLAP